MTGKTELDAAVDGAFKALRAAAPAPSAELMARVLADAAAEHNRRSRAVRRPGAAARLAGWIARGAWAGPGLGVAAAATGLVIGLAEPVPLDLIGLAGASEVALLPDADLLAEFGAEDVP
jgi:hypothetical protein